jgi:folate-binding protein YgfZ
MTLPFRCLPPVRRSLFSFRGPDAERYLNGQLTQDVRDLGKRALLSCVTDAKGRLQAMVQVFRGPDGGIWVEGPAEQEAELEQRLTRYLIADDVEVANLSTDWWLAHAIDAAAPPAPATGFVREAVRLGDGGHDLWLPEPGLPECGTLSAAEAETRRIHARIPAWGAELTAGMLPPEAGLDRTAISYHKGCYIGQEVLSRIKSAGRLNRKLAAFLVEPGFAPGDALRMAGGSRPAGTLTSVAPWPNDAGLHAALGYLDKSAFETLEFEIEGKPGLAQVLGFV